MKRRPFLLVFFISLIFFMFLGYIISSTSMSEFAYLWYDSLEKSPYTPKNEVFGAVWTILYFINALAYTFFLINKRYTAEHFYEKAIRLFIIQFILQILWSYLFFVFLSPLLALINIIVLDILVYAMLRNILNISRMSFLLFMPYFFWLIFASYLNLYIVLSN